jgi:hypothetical protein
MKTIAEVNIDASRVARLLDSGTALRIVLFDGAREVGAIPLAERSVEAVRRASSAIHVVAAKLSRAPEPPAPPVVEERPYTFADKVETLARHLDKMDELSRDAEAKRLIAAGWDEARVAKLRGTMYRPEVQEGRDYWYVSRNGSRRYAVDVRNGIIYPVGSGGVMKYQGFGSLDTIGEYDWNDRYYSHRKLASPMLVEMHRSSLKSPETKVKKEPTYPLRTVDDVDHRAVGVWSGWEKSPEKLKPRGRVIVGGGYYGDAWEGEKYSSAMPMSDIVKSIRKEFADDTASGFLPRGTTFSVTQRDGNHIRVTIMRVPGVQIVTRAAAFGSESVSRSDYYTGSAQKLKEYVESVLGAYNHDASNSQMDYYQVNFYDTIDFSDVLELQQISDLRALERQGDRVDVYLTHSLDEALEAKKLRGWSVQFGPRVVILGAGAYRIEWVEGSTLSDRVLSPKKILASEVIDSPAQALEMAEGWAREELGGKKRKANHSNAQMAVVGLMGASGVYALGRGMMAARRAKTLDARVIAALRPYRPTVDTRIQAPQNGYNGSPFLAELQDPEKLTPGHEARKLAILQAAADGTVSIATDARGGRYLHLPGDPVTIDYSQRYSRAL